MRALPRWSGAANRAIVVTASSLVSRTAITSVLGFVYWWLAAREFPPATVGFAAAAISAMMLVGSVGVLGFGTLLIRELPRHHGEEASLILTSLATVAVVSGALGALASLALPHLSEGLRPLTASF